MLGLVLAGAALFLGYNRYLLKTSAVALLLLMVMVLIRDLVRTTYLAPYFTLEDLQVKAEYSPMIFFLVLFVAGLALVGYMLKMALDCGKEVK